MLHYHGTPITPRAQLVRMAGRLFCVSYAAPQDLATCLRIGQSVMLDNGAFSVFTRGAVFDREGFYAWIEPHLAHPHWAVVPDEIGGTVEQQRAMVATWLYRANGSNVAGAAVDSLIFPTLAFGVLMPHIVALQFVAKVAGGAAWAWALSRIQTQRVAA